MKNYNKITRIEIYLPVTIFDQNHQSYSTPFVLTKDGNRSGRPAGRVTSRVENLRPAELLKHRSNSPFVLLKDIYAPTEIYIRVYICFIIIETCYKKRSINKPHRLETLVDWFEAVTNVL